MSQKGLMMTQIHKQFSSEQVKVLLQAYEAGHLSRNEIERTLGIGKTRFFTLLRQYREDPESFSIQYERTSPRRLSAEAEAKIRKELQREKELVENKDLPISGYNYAALNDRLKKDGIQVSTTTIIQRAIAQGCYLPKKRKTERHDREVLTSTIGD
jgi:transposase